MSWFFSKHKTNLPAPTALEQQRTRQIESLKNLHSVVEVERDVEYRITFTVVGGPLTLKINLPPGFPSVKPEVRVQPAIQHPWVNSQLQVVACPALLSFTVHSDLSRAIKDIMEEFQRNPPVFTATSYGQPPGGAPSLPYSLHPSTAAPTLPSYAGTYGGTGPPEFHDYVRDTNLTSPTLPATRGTYRPPANITTGSQGQEPSFSFTKYQMPEIPVSFPQLHNMSIQQLQEFENDEGKLLGIIEELSSLVQLKKDRKEFCEENEKLARENLSKEPEIESLKDSLTEQFTILKDLKSQFDQNVQKQQELHSAFNPGHLQANLKIAVMQAEETSENIAEEFLDGKCDISTFNQQFLEKRKIFHLRRTKEEKLQQLLVHTGRGGGGYY